MASIVSNIMTLDDESHVKAYQERFQNEMKPAIEAMTIGCTLPSGIKFGLQVIGVPAGAPRLPLMTPSPEKLNEIQSALLSSGKLLCK